MLDLLHSTVPSGDHRRGSLSLHSCQGNFRTIEVHERPTPLQDERDEKNSTPRPGEVEIRSSADDSCSIVTSAGDDPPSAVENTSGHNEVFHPSANSASGVEGEGDAPALETKQAASDKLEQSEQYAKPSGDEPEKEIFASKKSVDKRGMPRFKISWKTKNVIRSKARSHSADSPRMNSLKPKISKPKLTRRNISIPKFGKKDEYPARCKGKSDIQEATAGQGEKVNARPMKEAQATKEDAQQKIGDQTDELQNVNAKSKSEHEQNRPPKAQIAHSEHLALARMKDKVQSVEEAARARDAERKFRDQAERLRRMTEDFEEASRENGVLSDRIVQLKNEVETMRAMQQALEESKEKAHDELERTKNRLDDELLMGRQKAEAEVKLAREIAHNDLERSKKLADRAWVQAEEEVKKVKQKADIQIRELKRVISYDKKNTQGTIDAHKGELERMQRIIENLRKASEEELERVTRRADVEAQNIKRQAERDRRRAEDDAEKLREQADTVTRELKRVASFNRKTSNRAIDDHKIELERLQRIIEDLKQQVETEKDKKNCVVKEAINDHKIELDRLQRIIEDLTQQVETEKDKANRAVEEARKARQHTDYLRRRAEDEVKKEEERADSEASEPKSTIVSHDQTASKEAIEAHENELKRMQHIIEELYERVDEENKKYVVEKTTKSQAERDRRRAEDNFKQLKEQADTTTRELERVISFDRKTSKKAIDDHKIELQRMQRIIEELKEQLEMEKDRKNCAVDEAQKARQRADYLRRQAEEEVKKLKEQADSEANELKRIISHDQKASKEAMEANENELKRMHHIIEELYERIDEEKKKFVAEKMSKNQAEHDREQAKESIEKLKEQADTVTQELASVISFDRKTSNKAINDHKIELNRMHGIIEDIKGQLETETDKKNCAVNEVRQHADYIRGQAEEEVKKVKGRVDAETDELKRIISRDQKALKDAIEAHENKLTRMQHIVEELSQRVGEEAKKFAAEDEAQRTKKQSNTADRELTRAISFDERASREIIDAQIKELDRMKLIVEHLKKRATMRDGGKCRNAEDPSRAIENVDAQNDEQDGMQRIITQLEVQFEEDCGIKARVVDETRSDVELELENAPVIELKSLVADAFDIMCMLTLEGERLHSAKSIAPESSNNAASAIPLASTASASHVARATQGAEKSKKKKGSWRQKRSTGKPHGVGRMLYDSTVGGSTRVTAGASTAASNRSNGYKEDEDIEDSSPGPSSAATRDANIAQKGIGQGWKLRIWGRGLSSGDTAAGDTTVGGNNGGDTTEGSAATQNGNNGHCDDKSTEMFSPGAPFAVSQDSIFLQKHVCLGEKPLCRGRGSPESTVGDSTVGNTTVGDTTVGDTTMGDTTMGESIVSDSTISDSTVRDITVGSSRVGDSLTGRHRNSHGWGCWGRGTPDSMYGYSTAGDTSAGDTTVGDTTVGDSTAGNTSAGDTTIGDTTVEDATTGRERNCMYGNGTVGDTIVGDSSSHSQISGTSSHHFPGSDSVSTFLSTIEEAVNTGSQTPGRSTSISFTMEDTHNALGADLAAFLGNALTTGTASAVEVTLADSGADGVTRAGTLQNGMSKGYLYQESNEGDATLQHYVVVL